MKNREVKRKRSGNKKKTLILHKGKLPKRKIYKKLKRIIKIQDNREMRETVRKTKRREIQ